MKEAKVGLYIITRIAEVLQEGITLFLFDGIIK
jgi:hypothetical protein